MGRLFAWTKRRSAWLQDSFDELARAGLLVRWASDGKAIAVRPSKDLYPILWVHQSGQVDVTPFAGDVDHPGYRISPNDRNAETIHRIIRGDGSV